MTSYVVDASAAVEYLLRTRLGLEIAAVVDGADLLAPALVDVEVVSVLRRAVLNGGLAEARAALALDDLVVWPIDRIEHAQLAHTAWLHRHNVSAYDAFYVAAAQRYDLPLLTADGPLSRAPGIDVAVHNMRIA